MRPLEHNHPRLAERPREIARAVGLPVVIPEHGDDGNREPAAGPREDARLVDLSVLGQVAREKHEIGALLDVDERLTNSVGVARGRMDVGRGGDPDAPRCVTI